MVATPRDPVNRISIFFEEQTGEKINFFQYFFNQC